MARTKPKRRKRVRRAPISRRTRRQWQQGFRIMTVIAAALSIVFAVAVAPDVMYRDGNFLSASLLVLAPLLLVGAARLIYRLVLYSHR